MLDKRQAYSMRVKVDDKTKLEEVQKILEEKEKDTAMAAEIGQTLLEKNVQMESELSQLHTKVNEYQRLLMRMEEIQTEVCPPSKINIKFTILILNSLCSYDNYSPTPQPILIIAIFIVESEVEDSQFVDGESIGGSKCQQL